MWLTVFENGRARIPGTPFPLDPACNPKVDLLAYAIAEGKKKGVTVCPLVHAFQWGADVPAALQLRTRRGENSAQSAQRRFNINRLTLDTIMSPQLLKLAQAAPSPNLWVDPTTPETQAALKELFHVIRGHAGAGACVCRDLTPNGFSSEDAFLNSSFFASRCANMGCDPALRAAFLRKNHYDPIDIFYASSYGNTDRANISLAQYTQNGEYAEELWTQFCARSLQTTLHSLLEPLTQGGNSPGLVMERTSTTHALLWFDIVRDAKAPFADADVNWANRLEAEDTTTVAPPGMPIGVFFLSRDAIHRLPDEAANIDLLNIEMQEIKTSRMKRNWDGIVIEE